MPRLLIGVDPSTNRCFQRLWNIDHLAPLSYSQGDTKSRVKLSLTTLAPLLAADSMQGHQAPAKERLLVDELGQLGSGRAFGTGKLPSVFHQTTSFLVC